MRDRTIRKSMQKVVPKRGVQIKFLAMSVQKTYYLHTTKLAVHENY